MRSPDTDALFDAARRADILAVAGTPLFRAGRRMRGECPLCGASKGKRSDGAFSADPAIAVFKCFACGKGGDVIALEQLLRGGSAREAAERLVGPTPTRMRSLELRTQSPPNGTDQLARRLWSEAEPAAGTLVETYLAARGLRAALTNDPEGPLAQLRFHPDAPWGLLGASRVTRPAMVAGVRTHEGATGGVHLTYLAPNGTRKTNLTPARRMFGPQRRGGRPGGVLLRSVASHDRLIIAEGIETALSAAVLIGPDCAVMATLSLDRLQGGWSPHPHGYFDPDQPIADLTRPAFTWPRPDAPWREVVICVDRDMSPIRVNARRANGDSYSRVLDANARARLCGSLAEQHWRCAQPSVRARTAAPRLGRDFNDELLARSAG